MQDRSQPASRVSHGVILGSASGLQLTRQLDSKASLEAAVRLLALALASDR